MKVIAFFVRMFSAGFELGLNWNLDQAQTEQLLNSFLVCSVLVRLDRDLVPDQPEKVGKDPNGHIWLSI
jgi:hypothetical protein